MKLQANIAKVLEESLKRLDLLQAEFEQEKNRLMRMVGLSWDQIQAYRHPRQRSQGVRTVNQAVVPVPIQQRKVKLRTVNNSSELDEARFKQKRSSVLKEMKPGTVRLEVLKAIQHYELNNPESIVDKVAIENRINQANPEFLQKFSNNSISVVLTALGDSRSDYRGLIKRTQRLHGGRKMAHYVLTAEGKKLMIELKTSSNEGVHNEQK